ncbi:MAG: hypothetical protein Q4E64_06230 [Phascolarctobacterium sp.]|uniref:hypothetical protein n=1 Tax=Phascolarctobacterium sp. TaxID=2049039 RepID=UPI0026DCC811|nr:hypothetical protein [Phascolarctobacterium sp.]MDO4921403.1 hypothetical protein [Phascolarctobacterium sp.]
MNEVEFTKLLYDISYAYEHKIAELNSENKRLEHLLNDSVLYKTEITLKKILKTVIKCALNIIKYIVIRVGLKEYVKNLKLYKKYKNKGSF